MDIIITSKIDKNTIEVTKTKPAEELSPIAYTYEFLVQQKKDIEKQRDDYMEQRNKEISEIEMLLAECDKLGITKKIEPAPVEEPIEVIK